MPYNLIDEPWIPVRREDGNEEWIHPWEVTDHLEGASPIEALNAPRPDFNGSLMQFLIGLVQTAIGPRDQRAWRKRLQQPPSPEKLRDAFTEFGTAFELDGEPPRFMQDYDEIPDARGKQIAYLLVDSPSDNALSQNKDHFVKDRSDQQYCQACTAAALFSFQANAPQGGRGHRTSLRGGGPVTTLVMGHNLWHTLWLNTLPFSVFKQDGTSTADALSDVFPWLGSARTSGDDTVTTPEDVHELQAFWGMPRRIYLEPSEEKSGICDLCGRERTVFYSQCRTTNHGINYAGAWEHPLTPHWRTDDGEIRPIHGQQEGFSYRHWRGFAIGDQGEQEQPARVVNAFYDRAKYSSLDEVFQGRPRLWVFGFEVNKTKIRAWHESLMPLYRVDPKIRQPLGQLAAQLIDVSDRIANNLTQSLRRAMYGYPTATTRGNTSWDIEEGKSRDHTFFENAEVQFWHDTEPSFYETLDNGIESIEDERSLDSPKRSWVQALRNTALDLFDETTQYGHFHTADPKAVAIARQELNRFSSPRTSTIRKALDLPKPDAEAAA